jgi:hypothetical protein
MSFGSTISSRLQLIACSNSMNRCPLLDLDAQFVRHLRDAQVMVQGCTLAIGQGRQEWPDRSKLSDIGPIGDLRGLLERKERV